MDNVHQPMHFNHVQLCGQTVTEPELSHTNHGEEFFRFFLSVPRLSGQCDTLPVITPGRLLETFGPLPEGTPLALAGQLRSFNNKSPLGPRLILSAFAQELAHPQGAAVNRIQLCGTICKEPSLRRTPLGREICDIILAVNRRYGRADYLPCIAWGAVAQQAAHLHVGSSLALEGRIQSRVYTKTLDGQTEERTAYEVSIMRPISPRELLFPDLLAPH